MDKIVKKLKVKCIQFGVYRSSFDDMEIYLRKNVIYDCYIYDDNIIYLDTKDFKIKISNKIYEKYFKAIK